MNKIFVVGNLVDNAKGELVGEKETPKVSFTIAENKKIGKDKEKVTYFPCTIWGDMGKNLKEYLVKGQQIIVSGEMEINRVNKGDKDNADWRTYVNVNVSELNFGIKPKNEVSKNNKKTF